MVYFDHVVKALAVFLLALLAALIIIAFAAIQMGYDVVDVANDKFDVLEREINWRKL